MSPEPVTRLAELIAAAARMHARSSPAPRGVPFFGLDHRSGSAVELLGSLASHGIFRKYERVLDLAAHLGASSRWLAAMLGCTAVATAATAAEASAAGALTRTAGLGEQVHHVAAATSALPFADASFTHVWMVETLAFLADPDAALAEAARVLRPGGHVAVQELVTCDADLPAAGAARFGSAQRWAAALAAGGFVDLEVHDVSARACESAALLATARARLDATAAADRGLAAAARERRSIGACLASGRLGLIQILGRRP